MKNLKRLLNKWLPLAIAVTMLVFIVEVVVQQNYRTSANDPQIQTSEDLAAQFKKSSDASNYVPTEKTDIATSLGTVGIIYDKNGALLASSATLDNQTPALPKGVIDYANKHNQDRFTWQPKSGVRLAAVITKSDGGYVLIARNIREIEKRETQLSIMILAGWLGTLLATFGAVLILDYFENPKNYKKKPVKKPQTEL